MRELMLSLLVLSAVFNAGQLTLQLLDNQKKSSNFQLHNLADQFKGLETIFEHVRTAGYYTDKNIEHPLVIAQFEQAQYILAPTVLALNHTNYPLVIFDCSSPSVALNKIKELGFQPLKASQSGIILALNPQAKILNP